MKTGIFVSYTFFLSGFLLCQSGGGLKAQETLLKLQCAQSYYEVDALRKSVFTGNISTKEFDHLYVDHHHYPNRDNSDWEDLVSISDTDIRFGTIVNLPNGRFGLIEKWVIDRSAGTRLNGAMMPMGSCHKVDGRNLQNKF